MLTLTKQEFEAYASRFMRLAEQTRDDATRQELIKVAETWWSMAAAQEPAVAPPAS